MQLLRIVFALFSLLVKSQFERQNLRGNIGADAIITTMPISQNETIPANGTTHKNLAEDFGWKQGGGTHGWHGLRGSIHRMIQIPFVPQTNCEQDPERDGCVIQVLPLPVNETTSVNGTANYRVGWTSDGGRGGPLGWLRLNAGRSVGTQ
jgi:hypothetical protein